MLEQGELESRGESGGQGAEGEDADGFRQVKRYVLMGGVMQVQLRFLTEEEKKKQQQERSLVGMKEKEAEASSCSACCSLL